MSWISWNANVESRPDVGSWNKISEGFMPIISFRDDQAKKDKNILKLQFKNYLETMMFIFEEIYSIRIKLRVQCGMDTYIQQYSSRIWDELTGDTRSFFLPSR